MSFREATVVVSVKLPGQQAMHGRYSYFHKVNKSGEEINGVKAEQLPEFCECHKTLLLPNSFVLGSLNDPPEELKDHYRPLAWAGLTESKRIALHVKGLVNAIHPGHRGYSMEIV